MILKKYYAAVAVFVALTMAAVYFYKVESDYFKSFSVTSGTVSEIIYEKSSSGKSRYSTTVVSFGVGLKRYEAHSRGLQIPSFSGTIEVYYDPANPNDARIKRIDEVYLLTLIMLFFLLMGSLTSAITYFLTPFIRKLDL